MNNLSWWNDIMERCGMQVDIIKEWWDGDIDNIKKWWDGDGSTELLSTFNHCLGCNRVWNHSIDYEYCRWTWLHTVILEIINFLLILSA